MLVAQRDFLVCMLSEQFTSELNVARENPKKSAALADIKAIKRTQTSNYPRLSSLPLRLAATFRYRGRQGVVTVPCGVRDRGRELGSKINKPVIKGQRVWCNFGAAAGCTSTTSQPKIAGMATAAWQATMSAIMTRCPAWLPRLCLPQGPLAITQMESPATM